MSNGFGGGGYGGGGFDPRDSARSNVNRYYTYRQTSGGNGGGGGGSGCLAILVIIAGIALLSGIIYTII